MMCRMTENNSTQQEQKNMPPEDFSAAYENFDGFIQTALREYSTQGGWKKPSFIALLLASGQTTSIAKNAISSTDGLKKIALGTLGVVAARAILTRVIAGPIGLILTGVSVVSLVAVLVKNQKEILGKIDGYKALIKKNRDRYEEMQIGYHQQRIDAHERNLMVEGLLKRFLADCDDV